ncbi:hypothetical protein O181_041128 [Austropuccinia psidii MF-1]|uniref:Uncharacterized protein n=1 Tax=Austropuccinia psidii MF-1 TaxID=1389203 RepID=A0A9Q3HDI3_9BASI|nr:hypothetical protein [Austropuccinia psidii MF-1]
MISLAAVAVRLLRAAPGGIRRSSAPVSALWLLAGQCPRATPSAALLTIPGSQPQPQSSPIPRPEFISLARPIPFRVAQFSSPDSA